MVLLNQAHYYIVVNVGENVPLATISTLISGAFLNGQEY